MPIYEYRCEACGEELEKLQRMSDPPLTDCPACGRPALKRLVSAAGFRLKGGGWYETDFKQGNRRNVAAGDSDAGAQKKNDGKSDQKGGDKATSASSGKGAGGDGSGKSSSASGSSTPAAGGGAGNNKASA